MVPNSQFLSIIEPPKVDGNDHYKSEGQYEREGTHNNVGCCHPCGFLSFFRHFFDNMLTSYFEKQIITDLADMGGPPLERVIVKKKDIRLIYRLTMKMKETIIKASQILDHLKLYARLNLSVKFGVIRADQSSLLRRKKIPANNNLLRKNLNDVFFALIKAYGNNVEPGTGVICLQELYSMRKQILTIYSNYVMDSEESNFEVQERIFFLSNLSTYLDAIHPGNMRHTCNECSAYLTDIDENLNSFSLITSEKISKQCLDQYKITINNLAVNFELLESHYIQAHVNREHFDLDSAVHEKENASYSIDKNTVGLCKQNATNIGVQPGDVKDEDSTTKVYSGKGTRITSIGNPVQCNDDLNGPIIVSLPNFMSELKSRLDKVQDEIRYEKDVSHDDASLEHLHGQDKLSNEVSPMEGLHTDKDSISAELETLFSNL